MDDEVRRLERLVAQDPALRPALQLALRRAGLPARDVAGILEEAAGLNGALEAARAAWLAELTRCWPPLLDALFREQPALDLLVVTTCLEEHHDRPWAFLVHAAADPAVLDELQVGGPDVWRLNQLEVVARQRIVDAVLAVAPVFALERWRRAARVVARRGPDGAVQVEARELERWANTDVLVAPSARRELDEAGDDRELRDVALIVVGAREVPLADVRDARAEPAAGAASVAELVERADAATAARDAARQQGLAALGEAFDRLVPALFERHPDLPGLAVHGFTPTFMDGEPCEHLQEVLVTPDRLQDLGDELAQRGLPDLGLGALAARTPRRGPDGEALLYVRVREALDPFEAALEARHGRCWVFVLERRDDGGVDVRVGPGYRPY